MDSLVHSILDIDTDLIMALNIPIDERDYNYPISIYVR